ncbi:MAG TPA: M48 family metalloprotease [Pyrinomonadaceae bacterium]|nr:M48 family metalloprotease [Pyrinomonadaceae bacterium]
MNVRRIKRALSTLLAASLLLSILVGPAPTALAQQKQETPEEKKLREQEDKAKKKEEEKKGKEEKERAKETKKYNTLKDFSEDLYASNFEYRDQVDEQFLELQGHHAREAYYINNNNRVDAVKTGRDSRGDDLLELRRVLYDNPRVAEYINRLGQRLVPEDSDKLYTFKVTVNPIPTAYTLSTGTVLISSGMVSLLDNEAQLAYVLAHELAHVHRDHWKLKVMMDEAQDEYNRKQENKARWRGALIGLAAGAALGAAAGAGAGDTARVAYYGMSLGQDIAVRYAKRLNVDWHTLQEDEADDFALKLVLANGYDAQEVPKLYDTLARVARSDARMQLGFLGNRGRIRQRSEFSQRQLKGALSGKYQELLAAGKLLGTSPEFSLIMAELKRDNGIEAFQYDMLSMAKANLQQAHTLRSDDPLATYYYARVLKQVGRTPEELTQAQQLILSAIRLDTRQNIPEIQLHRAMLLIDSKEPGQQAEAVDSLKKYVTAYQKKRIEERNTDTTLPGNIDIIYDYMRLLGEKSWRAPSAQPVLAGGVPTAPPPALPASSPATSRPVPASGTRKP